MSRIIRTDAEGFVIEQGSQAWKQLRVGFGTASSAADILPGKKGGYLSGRAKLIDELVYEVITGKPAGGFYATKFMRDGIAREPYARMAYQERTGFFVEEVAFTVHGTLPVGSSPDGLVVGQRRGVEIKSPKETTHVRYLELDTCPEEYVAQVQQNIWIHGYDCWDFVSYSPDFPEHMQLQVITVQRDEATIQALEREWAKVFVEVNERVAKLRAKFPATLEIA